MTYEKFCLMLVTRDNRYLDRTNHTLDNHFFDSDPKQMWRNMEHSQLELLGINFSPPYWKYDKDDVALVFKDYKYDEVYWVHFTRYAWERSLIKCFGEEKGNKAIEQLYSWFKEGEAYD